MQVPFLVAQGKYLLAQVLAYVPSLMAVILGLEWSDTVLYTCQFTTSPCGYTAT